MPGMQMVLRPMGSVHLPLLMPATNEQATCVGLPAVKVSGGVMPPNVSLLTVSSAAATAVGDEGGVRPAGLGTVGETVPAAQPMVPVAPYDAEVSTLGEYLLMAACMVLVAGMESSNHGTSCVLPIAPFNADGGSHGVVISPAVVT